LDKIPFNPIFQPVQSEKDLRQQSGSSASAVGQATTSAVFTTMASIIVATAIIQFVCNVLGI
jgi:hypothetical protein